MPTENAPTPCAVSNPRSRPGAAVAVLLCVCCLLTALPAGAQDAVVIGSSFITNLAEYSQSLVRKAGLTATNKKCQIIGAPIGYIWQHCSETSPVKACEELPKGTHEILYLNAQRPWEQTEREVIGCDSFANLGMSNPLQRVFINEYWIEELAPDCFNADCRPAETIAMYRRSAMKVAYEVARFTGVPVYIVPNGTVIERTKEMAAAGALDGYTSRMDPMASDGKHLSKLGQYVQALAFSCAGWRRDVRGWSDTVFNSWNGVEFQTTRDNADTLQRMVYNVVRTTPFSGYCATDPTTYQGYMAALKDSMQTWEGFDNMVQASKGSGSFVGDNGIAWSYTNATKKNNWYVMTDDHVEMYTGSSIAATLPAGLVSFSFAGRVNSGGSAQVRVMVNGSLLATHTVNVSKPCFSYTARGMNLSGAVQVRLETTVTSGSTVLLDNLVWEERAGMTVVDDAARAVPVSVRGSVTPQQRFELTGRRLVSGSSGGARIVLTQSAKGPGAPAPITRMIIEVRSQENPR